MSLKYLASMSLPTIYTIYDSRYLISLQTQSCYHEPGHISVTKLVNIPGSTHTISDSDIPSLSNIIISLMLKKAIDD